jgi:hypothetical protein
MAFGNHPEKIWIHEGSYLLLLVLDGLRTYRCVLQARLYKKHSVQFSLRVQKARYKYLNVPNMILGGNIVVLSENSLYSTLKSRLT